MTVYTAGQYRDILLKKLARSQRMEVDLSDVDEIDTAGLQLLVSLKHQYAAVDNGLCLNNPADVVRDALELAQLTDDFELHEAGRD